MKRFGVILAVILLMAALLAFPVSAAETHPLEKGEQVAKAADQMQFPEDDDAAFVADCPVCEVSVSWVGLGQADFATAKRLANGEHYYLKESVEGENARILAPETSGHEGCFHLNGKNITSTSTSYTAVSGSGGVLNIMGKGNVKGSLSTSSKYGATVQINTAGSKGAINLYGGTYGKLTPSDNINVIAIRANGGIINLYAGATVQSGTDGSAIYINGDASRVSAMVNIYGATVDAGTSEEPAVDIRPTSSANGVVCNLYDGRIVDGTGTNGGNVYVGAGSQFYMYDGAVSGGKAENGGNIYVDGGKFTMYGGTVSGGTATAEAGDIFLAAESNMYLLGGSVVGSQQNAIGSFYVAEGANLSLGGEAVVAEQAVSVLGKLNVCSDWSGSAEVSFATEYTSGAEIPADVAQVVILAEDFTVEVGGSFNGRLVQKGTTRSGLAPVGNGSLYVSQAQLVANDGTRVEADEPLTQWAQGGYQYIKLYADIQLDDLQGMDVTVDLNGYDLTVGGTGMLRLLDSANDTYDATKCGQVVNNGEVTVADDTKLGIRRYIALTEDGVTTVHCLDMRMTSVTLRPSATGLYYNAYYDCDAVLADSVQYYGVVLSLANMPGENFWSPAELLDQNQYTISTESFQGGWIATSGSVFGIMKETNTALTNAEHGETKIYANPYLCLRGDRIVVGDTENAGKTAESEDFDGVAYSLRDVMEFVEANYYTYEEEDQKNIDTFYTQWADKGMDWGFTNIASQARISNENLSFADNSNTAWCDVCKKQVEWTPITQQTHGESGIGSISSDGVHYYLAEDITYTGAANFVRAPGTGKTACLHLNGHDLTATAHRVITGYAGTLNVLGNGAVSGYFSTENKGAAVQINTSGSKGVVNLYGGTYSEYTNTAAVAICIDNNGGKVNVYSDAKITGDVYVGTAGLVDAVFGVYGGTVTGKITYAGAGSDNACKFVSTGQTELGTVVLPETCEATFSGAPKIGLLDLALGTKITVNNLARGTDITVRANAAFSTPNDQAAQYTDYFKPYFAADSIVSEDGVLVYAIDYTSYLSPWQTDVIEQAKADGKIHYYFMSSKDLYISLSYNNVKWGDCCLVVFPTGETMLVDSGYHDMGPLIWRNLERMGVSTLDYMVLSHYHMDHFGGVFGSTADGERIVESGFLDHITVKKLFVSEVQASGDTAYPLVHNTCQKYGIETQVLKLGDVLEIGGTTMEVLWPDLSGDDSVGNNIEDHNNNSLVLRFDYGEHSSLFTGDLYVEGEGKLLAAVNNTKLDVDFLKVPHHGRNTSSSEAFVNAVTPELAVATGRAARGQVDAVYEAVNTTLLNEWDQGYIHIAADEEGTMTHETGETNGFSPVG